MRAVVVLRLIVYLCVAQREQRNDAITFEHWAQLAFDKVLNVFRGRHCGVEDLDSMAELPRGKKGSIKVQGSASCLLAKCWTL